MAIGRWMPFGAAQSTHTSPPPAVPPPPPPPAIAAADAKHFGFENFGNTCYANSVLQALYFCGPFRELLTQYPDPSVPDLPAAPAPVAVPAAVPVTPASPAPARHKPQRKGSVSDPGARAHPTPAPPPPPPGPPAPPLPPAPPTLLSALRSLFLHISRHPADKGTVAPRAFMEKLRELNDMFRGNMHQDAHEFLNFLLNKIVEEMEEGRRAGGGGGGGGGSSSAPRDANGSANGHASGEDLATSVTTLSSATPALTPSVSTTHPSTTYHSTFVHRLFEGVLTSETRCLTCETVSSRDESFLDLSIDIEQNSSVTACLRQFSASEMLCQKNKFFCDACCDLQEAEKRMKIKRLPNVLALHLKRFKYQEDLGKYIKLAYRVAFPMELRLFNTVDDAEDPDRLYELFAIVVHIGNGPHHGHYVTLIKARGTWLLFDDDSVETVKESDIQKYFGESNAGAAYVLYYQAVDLDMAALGIRPPPPPPSAPSATDVGSAPASTAPADLEHEPGSPALPPGLTTEDTPPSEKSESPLPATPASPPPLSPLLPPPPGLTAPSAPGSPVSATTPTAPPPTPASGRVNTLFNTLRHVPSLKVRPTSSAGPGSGRPSILDGPAPPPAPARRPTTATGTPDPRPAPLSPKPSADGDKKEKSPEKKPSTWFRRKASRTEVSLGAFAPPEPRPSSAAGRERPQPLSVPASPAGLPSAPLSARALTEHKRSTPDLARGKSQSAGGSSGRLPRRPSTAPRASRTEPAPPVPPIPAMAPATPVSPVSPYQNGVDGDAHEPYVPGSPALLATTASTGTTGSGASGGEAGAPRKGARRKLSLTAPMLGFGRRDREKDRREREVPPTSFSMR